MEAWLLGYRGDTALGYRNDFTRFAEYLERVGDLQVLEVERAHVNAWVREMEDEGLAAATIRRRLAAISSFYTYALEEDLIGRSPVARVRRPPAPEESRRSGLDRDELRRFLEAAAAAGPLEHALACLLGLNGLRVSEACNARIADLEVARGHRTLRVTRKGGRRQVLALAARTAAAVDELVGDRRRGLIFPGLAGRPGRDRARRVVRRIAKAAGIRKPISPHSLRHSFVTAALDAGVPLRDIQDAAGHRSPSTTRQYDRDRHSLDRHPTYAVEEFLR